MKITDVQPILLRGQSGGAYGSTASAAETSDAGDWQIAITFPAGAYPDTPAETHTLMPPVFEGLEIP